MKLINLKVLGPDGQVMLDPAGNPIQPNQLQPVKKEFVESLCLKIAAKIFASVSVSIVVILISWGVGKKHIKKEYMNKYQLEPRGYNTENSDNISVDS